MNAYSKSCRWDGGGKLATAVALSLLLSNSDAGAQIAPNPNPQGNTITVSGSDENSIDNYQNLGIIEVLDDGVSFNDNRLESFGTINVHQAFRNGFFCRVGNLRALTAAEHLETATS